MDLNKNKFENRLSIITVTYNAEKCIAKTLESIVKQNVCDYELIVIDAKSHDRTLDIIKSFRSKLSSLFLLSERDNGIYDAMNKGVVHSSGNFILFLNAGDVFYDDNVLIKVLPLLSDEKCAYYGDAFSVGNKGDISPYRVGEFSNLRLANTNICHQTIFYPRTVLINNKFNLRYEILADWEINMRLFEKIPFKHLDFPIVLYDLSGVSATNQDVLFVKDQKRLILKYLGVRVLFLLVLRKIKNILID